MILQESIARERAWAVPGLCALMIFHHDFQIPRLAQVQHLAWSADALAVRLCYGVCNVSGSVVDATEFVVTLRRDGGVGMQVVQDDLVDGKQALVQFLTGEVWRETRRWQEDMQSWSEANGSLSDERAAILCLASALVAYPAPTAEINVDKDLSDRSRVTRIRVSDPEADFEITPAGYRSTNLYVYSRLPDTRAGRIYRRYDVQATPLTRKPRYLRLLDRATFTTTRLALLPMDLIVYLFERIQPRENRDFLNAQNDLPTRIIDPTAGDSLSALFN